MKNLTNILQRIYGEKWLILPAKYASITHLLESHLTGSKDLTAALPVDSEEEPKATSYVVGNVGVIPIDGTILPKCSGLELLCGGFSLEQFRQDLKAMANNPLVTCIVLDIDSGGGVSTGVEEAYDLIKQVAKVKNVIAYSSNYACSAAYWLMCAANQLFCSKSATIGSIGVYCSYVDESKAYQMKGLQQQVFKAGLYKAAFLEGTSLTDADKAMIQADVDECYRVFVSSVQAQRPKVTIETCQGQCFTGLKAIELGLIDYQVDDFENLIAYLNR